MLKARRHHQIGVSLIELMIGIVVGMVVVAAVIAIYVSTIRGGNNTLRTARLNQELRATMDIMVRDIRRAGFNGWNAAGTIVLSTDNDFAKRVAGGLQTDLRVQTVVNNGDCILFAYDLSNWGVIDASEYMGFRLSNGAVQMRRSGTTTNSANCSDGTWDPLTDSNMVNITALSFSTEGSQCMDFTTGNAWKVISASPAPTFSGCDAPAAAGVTVVKGSFLAPVSGDQVVETRQVRISMTGNFAADTTLRATATEEVQVRNDRIYTQP
jgi:prepilin peptidase dependent protein B